MKKEKLSLFISYSHRDEEIKKRIDVHLASLKRSDKIQTWNDRKLDSGTEWDKKIKKELNEADIILLLISADFIASNYIWNVEIKKSIERQQRNEAVVIPIFCEACDFKGMPFAKLQGLPIDAKPLANFDDINIGLTQVAKGIRKIVELHTK